MILSQMETVQLSLRARSDLGASGWAANQTWHDVWKKNGWCRACGPSWWVGSSWRATWKIGFYRSTVSGNMCLFVTSLGWWETAWSSHYGITYGIPIYGQLLL